MNSFAPPETDDDVFPWVDLILDYLSSEEFLSLTPAAHLLHERLLFLCAEFKVLSVNLETSFCKQSVFSDIMCLDSFQSVQPQ